MNILLTGALSPVVWGMVERLERDDHHVTIVGRIDGARPAHTSAVFHNTHYSNPDAQKLIKPGYFQTIVFFFAYQCEEAHEHGSAQSSMLDVLLRFRQAAEQNGIERFILVTDQRVFGSLHRNGESKMPIPDSPAGIYIKAAEDSLIGGRACAVKTLILRVTHLYLPGAEDAFFGRVLLHARNKKPMVLEGTGDTPCDFLHADDLAQFICLAMHADVSGIFHLAYEDMCTYEKVIEALRTHLPELTVLYTGRQARDSSLRTSKAAKQTGWVPRHHWAQELSEIVSDGEGYISRRKRFSWLPGLGNRLFGKALPWVELVLFGGLAQWLTSLSSVYATFRFADFWLFYPILMGSLHGGLIGIMAALIACVFYGLDWVTQGNDLYLLLYNIDNWLPLMVYLLAGGLFGYKHDKDKETMKMLEREKGERDTEAAFMESMYRQASEDRSQLQKQVMSARDSYGRIFAITRELDTMQPEQVFLSTLSVVEDTMQNHSVAIYSRIGNTSFARLVVHSRGYEGKLMKSPDVAQYPLMKARLDRGEIFVNTSLEAGYPAFCAPIMQVGRPIAMIALWDVPFDRQTLYHQNLFSVVTGLVQSAMVRTLRDFDMSQDVYLDHTHIMTGMAFRSALGVYQRMKKQGTSNYILLRVKKNTGDTPPVEMDRSLGAVTRTTDLAARIDNGDYLVLLPQADMQDMPQIKSRFKKTGLACEVVAAEAEYA